MRSAKDIAAQIMRIAETAVVPDAEVAAWERRRDQDKRRERIRPYASAVTSADVERIVIADLDSLAWRAIGRFLSQWSAGAMSFLWLTGEMGLGKTVGALAAIAQEGGRLVSAQDVARAFGQETEEARDLRRHMLEPRLLVIDDGGTELDAKKARHGMHQVLDMRQNRLATIVTTNLSETETRKRYDARTVRRVEHQGAFFEVKGADMRRNP